MAYTVVILLWILLIGQRFGFLWAGTDAFNSNEGMRIVAVVGADVGVAIGDWMPRRRMMETPAGARIFLQSDEGVMMALDERTQTRIESVKQDALKLRLGRGRIVVFNPTDNATIHVKTNQTENTFTNGWVTFVNYDFLNEIAFLSRDTEVTSHLFLSDLKISSRDSIRIHESNPVSYGVSPFDVEAPSVANFYDWAASMMPPPTTASSQ